MNITREEFRAWLERERKRRETKCKGTGSDFRMFAGSRQKCPWETRYDFINKIKRHIYG